MAHLLNWFGLLRYLNIATILPGSSSVPIYLSVCLCAQIFAAANDCSGRATDYRLA